MFSEDVVGGEVVEIAFVVVSLCVVEIAAVVVCFWVVRAGAVVESSLFVVCSVAAIVADASAPSDVAVRETISDKSSSDAPRCRCSRFSRRRT